MRSYKVDIEVFERMPVARAVLAQSIPAIVAQLIVLLYNWADTFFLARLNKPELVAAATIVLPLYLMLTAIGNLPGVGGGSQFANHLGKHDYTGAQRVASITFWMGMILALVCCLSFPLYSDILLSLIGANERTLAPAQEYAFWVITIGGIPVIMNLVLANLVRAEGMALQASIGISAGGILNCLLDPLLMLPSMGNMGIVGAGIATAVSNMVSVLWLIVVIWRRRKTGVLTFAPQLLRYTRHYIGSIAKVGFPSSIQYMLTVVAVAALTHFVAQYNTEATAALGIVKRLDYLPLYFTIGLSQGILPLLAYNHSSGNVARRNHVFKCGCIISFGFAMLCFAVLPIGHAVHTGVAHGIIHRTFSPNTGSSHAIHGGVLSLHHSLSSYGAFTRGPYLQHPAKRCCRYSPAHCHECAMAFVWLHVGAADSRFNLNVGCLLLCLSVSGIDS